MSDAMNELDAAINSGRMHHDGNAIMTFCISNIIGKTLRGSDDIVRPIKDSVDRKIDGGVGLIMAVKMRMAPIDKGSFDEFIRNPVIA